MNKNENNELQQKIFVLPSPANYVKAFMKPISL